MNYKIVTDSSSNLFALADMPFSFVPLKIITAEKEYVDTPELDLKEMTDNLATTKAKTGTSCPNMHEWLEAFEGADHIFAVTITSNLSGSYASAAQAAEEYMSTHPGAKVHVIDSLSAGPELILLIDKLKEMILENLSFEAIKNNIQEYLKKTHLLFSLQSLTNLARNGRVSPTVAKVAGVLGIRVVGKASDEGTLEPLHKCRGEKKALDSIVSEMIAHGFTGAKVYISHCFNLESANELKKQILSKFPGSDIQINKCSALCSYYAEVGGLLVGFES